MIITAWKLGASARDRQRGRAQAGQPAPLTAPRSPSWRRGRPARRRPQRRHGSGPGIGDALGAPPGRRQDRLHRLDRDRPARWPPSASGRQAGLARARRQEPAGRAGRRRRPRSGGPAIGWGIFYNSGQTCNAGLAAGRPRSVREELVERDRRARAAAAPGEPLDPATRLGSIVDERQLAKVLGYVGLGREEGARVVAGGERVRQETGGYYVEPTILDGVANTMRVAREEIFGPVLTVTEFEDEEEAIAIANDTPYGLAAGSVDPRRQPRATGCRAGSGPGSSGSTPSTRPTSPSRSGATSNPASGATRVSTPSTATPS